MDFDERRKYKVKIKLYPLYPITSDFDKENGTREKRWNTGASLTKRQISRGLIRKTGMRKERDKNKDTTGRRKSAKGGLLSSFQFPRLHGLPIIPRWVLPARIAA